MENSDKTFHTIDPSNVENVGYMECPPFSGKNYCSDDNCPCDNIAIPPAPGFFYISPEVVAMRQDCLTRESVEAKFSQMKSKIGNVTILNSERIFFPIVLCEKAARLRRLDLDVAAQDYNSWVRTGKVPCRATPIVRLKPDFLHDQKQTEDQPITFNLQDTEPLVNEEKSSKPWLLVLNIILLIGLIVLYFLFFSEKGNDISSSMTTTIAKAGSGSMAVAFVNNDSILANYDLVKKLKKGLEAKGDRLTSEVAAKQKAFEKDAAYFQEQVEKKTISEQSAQEIYSSLMQSQQKIYDLRDQYASELQKEEMDMNVALLDSVMNFLRRYNQKYKFDYILGFNKGGNILYANDTLDITRDVIRELNQEYHKRNPD